MSNIILEEFKNYKESIYPEGVPIEQEKEIEQAYVMGAFTAFNIWISMGEKESSVLEKEVSSMYKFFYDYKEKRVNELMKNTAHKFDE